MTHNEPPASGAKDRRMSIVRRHDRASPTGPVRFTIGTLVSSLDQHAEMVRSFRAHGFDGPDVEFIHIDNTGAGRTDAYRGLNALLGEASGDYVILCHQDIRLVDDGRDALERCLAELDARDPGWGLAGNAGARDVGRLALRISDPHGADRSIGPLPARVMSLDENLIVARRAARLSCSRDLEGFHLYGADICLVADVLGWSAWVIDFHVRHLSAGRKDASFHAAERRFRAKWSRALRPRYVQTTCTLIHIAGGAVANALGRWSERSVAALSRRLPSARGWTRRTSS